MCSQQQAGHYALQQEVSQRYSKSAGPMAAHLNCTLHQTLGPKVLSPLGENKHTSTKTPTIPRSTIHVQEGLFQSTEPQVKYTALMQLPYT
jgi:hypothetical protein